VTTHGGLEAFTLYLDSEDPEDVPIIRYLKSKLRKKKASGELRTAMLHYLEYLKGNNLAPMSHSILPGIMSDFAPPAQISAPQLTDQEAPAANSKSAQEARRSFMKR